MSKETRMKILMLAEYFHPFAHGGSEWSVYYLAKALQKIGVETTILTPNYGTKPQEVWKNIRLIRFPSFTKLSPTRPKAVQPFLQNNPLWTVVSFIAVAKEVMQQKKDIIHIQGKSLLPAAILAKWLLKKSVVMTIRDYYILCPYGLCITKERAYRRCSLQFLLKNEFKKYYEQYAAEKNIFSWLFHLISALNARLTASTLRWFLKHVDQMVCISRKQQKIYHVNGFENTCVIYNMMDFGRLKKTKNNGNLVFAGRITPGKGADLFVEALIFLHRKGVEVKAQLIGDGFLGRELKESLKAENMKNVTFFGQLSYKKTMDLLKKAQLVVVPSTWEEPFGRVALEALSSGVPVIASSRGGLPEIVNNKKTGFVTEPATRALARSIQLGMEKNILLRENIAKQYPYLQKKFGTQPLKQYMKLYKKYA